MKTIRARAQKYRDLLETSAAKLTFSGCFVLGMICGYFWRGLAGLQCAVAITILCTLALKAYDDQFDDAGPVFGALGLFFINIWIIVQVLGGDARGTSLENFIAPVLMLSTLVYRNDKQFGNQRVQ